MKGILYILPLLLILAACSASDSREQASHAAATSASPPIRTNLPAEEPFEGILRIAIDTPNVFLYLHEWAIAPNLAADSASIDPFRPYLYEKKYTDARFMQRITLDQRTEFIVLHENNFHDNFIYGFVIDTETEKVIEHLTLAGRLNFEGSETAEFADLKFVDGILCIDQSVKSCTGCMDVGSNYPVLICDSCVTRMKNLHVAPGFRRIMTRPDESHF